MKTIAISIDESTIEALGRITRDAARRQGGRERGAKTPNRSELVRKALREFLERRERSEREAGERLAISRHRELLAREAAALVGEQAKA